jgi:hypothetical protein
MELNKMTNAFFGPSPTPTTYQYTYSKGGSPYYGDKPMGLYGLGAGLPQRTSVLEILKNSDHIQLYGGMNGLGEANTATTTTAAAVTTGIFTGAVIAGLGISYLMGRYIGAPIIEAASGKKLTTGQKRGVGLATMIL